MCCVMSIMCCVTSCGLSISSCGSSCVMCRVTSCGTSCVSSGNRHPDLGLRLRFLNRDVRLRFSVDHDKLPIFHLVLKPSGT